jgi:microcystin-dependent protein
MSDQFIGEIRIFGFGFAPAGWAHCDGATLAVNQNQSLFSLIGTLYGGNGFNTFSLPDLRDRVAIHGDSNFVVGKKGGEAGHVLTMSEMPQEATHSHAVECTTAAGTTYTPAKSVLANPGLNAYAKQSSPQRINPQTIGEGGGKPHENMSPYQVVNFCVALTGAFPSKN